MMMRLMTPMVSGSSSEVVWRNISRLTRRVFGRWKTARPWIVASLILSKLIGPYPILFWWQDSLQIPFWFFLFSWNKWNDLLWVNWVWKRQNLWREKEWSQSYHTLQIFFLFDNHGTEQFTSFTRISCNFSSIHSSKSFSSSHLSRRTFWYWLIVTFTVFPGIWSRGIIRRSLLTNKGKPMALIGQGRLCCK